MEIYDYDYDYDFDYFHYANEFINEQTARIPNAGVLWLVRLFTTPFTKKK